MTGKKRMLCALLCALALGLSGCVGNSQPQERETNGETLPEVRSGPEAPIGDSQTPRSFDAVLYVPSSDGTRLIAEVRQVTVESWQTKQDAIAEALMNRINESDFNASGRELQLAKVSNRVETTGSLATVSLNSTIRALSDEAQFALRMALVNTLTELPETSYVNILTYGRDYGLDAEGIIPTGVMSRQPDTDISTYWSQIQAQRTSAAGELQKTASLYFVSEDGKSLLGEVRNVTLSERSSAAYARVLLDELAKGAISIDGARTLVPPLEYFERDPVMQTTEDGNYIALYFLPAVNDFLALRAGTTAMMLSSICFTLTSFIPRIDGIIVYIDGEMVTELTLSNGEFWDWEMHNGQLTRESVASLSADVATIYYPLETGEGLYPLKLSIAQSQRSNPRALLQRLMQPPGRAGLDRALPETITDADIIGLQVQGDTAVINVSRAFAAACADLSETQECNMIYAIVNTLTEMEGISRVRFFVDGTQAQLAGYLFMSGEFMRNIALAEEGALTP